MKLLITLTFLMLTSAYANICNQEKMHLIGGTDFYKSFLKVSSKLKQPYTHLYRKVNHTLTNHIEDSCHAGLTEKEVKELNLQHTNLCLESCEQEAPLFHDRIKTKLFKKGKIKQLIKECQRVCRMKFSCDDDQLCHHLKK